MKFRNSLIAAGVIAVLCAGGTVQASIGKSKESYSKGQTVEVSWHGKWYDATVLTVKGSKYKVRYIGFSSNWDEWIGVARMRTNR